MATETVNQTNLDATPTGERVDIALQATYQIDALMNVLMKGALAPEDDTLPYLVQAVSARAHDLNSVIMSALNDDGETRASLNLKLNMQRA